MRSHRPLHLAVVLVATLALTACGDKGRSLPSDKATPVAVGSVPATVYPAPTKAVPTPTGAEPGTPAASPTGGGGGGGGNAVKATAANKFEPASLKVKKGTKVTWTSEGGVHSVTSGTPTDGADPKGPMKSPLPFQTYSVTFDKPGTYKYYCQPHATLGMEGEIVVT